MVLARLFRRNATQDAALLLYRDLVSQSRHPVFYVDHGVPDTVDGRFDMIVLHVYLLAHRLKGEARKAADDLQEYLLEVLFDDMDQGLREMGVGDLSVGKQVKNMANAFFGRAQAYDKVLDQDPPNATALAGLVARNIFRNDTGTVSDGATVIADYAIRQAGHLADQLLDDLNRGRVSLLAPPARD